MIVRGKRRLRRRGEVGRQRGSLESWGACQIEIEPDAEGVSRRAGLVSFRTYRQPPVVLKSSPFAVVCHLTFTAKFCWLYFFTRASRAQMRELAFPRAAGQNRTGATFPGPHVRNGSPTSINNSLPHISPLTIG